MQVYSSYDAHVMLLLFMGLFFLALLIFLDFAGQAFHVDPSKQLTKNFRNDGWGADDEGKENAVTCFRDITNAYCNESMASNNNLSILLVML